MLGRWKGLVVEGSGLETVCEDELWIWVGLARDVVTDTLACGFGLTASV